LPTRNEHALTFLVHAQHALTVTKAAVTQAAVTQAAAVTTAARNSKDDSNNMTAHNSRNASNSRNESNIRTANAVGTPITAQMLAKVKKPATACREDNNSIDPINMRWQQQ
jgi:hypothetical protein